VNGPEDLHVAATLLTQLELATGLERGKIRIEAQIESAEGLTNVDAIARSTGRLEALHFGPGDFAASLRMPQTSIGVMDEWDEAYPGHRFHYVMQRIVVAARAAGVRALDGPVADYGDEEGLRKGSSSPALWASTASGVSTRPRSAPSTRSSRPPKGRSNGPGR
jgi:citrate lyase beta subunit